jgi:hypothetical protein
MFRSICGYVCRVMDAGKAESEMVSFQSSLNSNDYESKWTGFREKGREGRRTC